MDRPSHFKVTDNGTYYTIENVIPNDFDNYHTHLRKKGKKKTSCDLLIELICSCKVPDSTYLRTSAKRISRNEKYIRNIEIKEEKDSQKLKFHKVNNGRK